ncbi:hypothetical protein FC093_16630 [Ilyomonas limi]|uniref:Uncharacterized protein n=1 Tax=Ilyomonas limi TaxID=2575867 RepID=A0A4U3KVV6_9BACT|nr:hypothetical protein [Ilyomonas limi]TKK66661.1 hypothetical protein FC093_16630 [Ilyomonas limi]
MKFSINYKGKEVMIDVTSWKSTINNRIEFYVVFADQQETFINFVKRTGQTDITEVSSSADLTAAIKAVIKDKLIYFTQYPNKL